MCSSCRSPSISAQLIKTNKPTTQRKYTAAEQKKFKTVLSKTQLKAKEVEKAKVKAKEAAKAKVKAKEAAKAKVRAKEAAKSKSLKKSKTLLLRPVSLRQVRRI